MRSRSSTHLGFTLLAAILTACSGSLPHRHIVGEDDVECGVVASAKDERCFARTPEVSKEPPYTLHFIEFDDQGWLYPDATADGYVKEMGAAHGQLDRAVEDVRSQLDDGKRVLLLVYVHGWKHSAAHDDRDVRRFRQMLADAAYLDEKRPTAEDASKRRVVGIYVGWRGAGRFSAKNPLVYLTFWSRKNAALHVSEGAARELFGRLRALRERVNHEDVPPPLRTVVIGHSFGAWVVFSALSPSLLELLASPLDAARDASSADARSAWRRARLRQAADIVVLVNPAFEASRYQPVHHLAQRLKLAHYEPPVLLLVTSTADRATRQLFPVGRFVNTIFQHPFVSDEQERATKHTPGFVDLYQTHNLTREPSAQVAECSGWAEPPLDVVGESRSDVSAESEADRIKRLKINASLESRRHAAWLNYVAAHPEGLPQAWEWRYCGGAFIRHNKKALNPGSLVWNVLTDDTLVKDHSDIMREPLHAFLRQLYLDLPR